ncbi:MAG: hypothetical protein BWY28_01017 [bacterium ADurb.Bin236]|nr:MAG: hypothetical protein BWY28_01017 [bacterium ADurb.Bin236]
MRGNHFFVKNRFPRAPSKKNSWTPILLNFVQFKIGSCSFM